MEKLVINEEDAKESLNEKKIKQLYIHRYFDFDEEEDDDEFEDIDYSDDPEDPYSYVGYYGEGINFIYKTKEFRIDDKGVCYFNPDHEAILGKDIENNSHVKTVCIPSEICYYALHRPRPLPIHTLFENFNNLEKVVLDICSVVIGSDFVADKEIIRNSLSTIYHYNLNSDLHLNYNLHETVINMIKSGEYDKTWRTEKDFNEWKDRWILFFKYNICYLTDELLSNKVVLNFALENSFIDKDYALLLIAHASFYDKKEVVDSLISYIKDVLKEEYDEKYLDKFASYDEEEMKKTKEWGIIVNKDNTCTLRRYYGHDTSIVIPETIYGMKVTKIGDMTFNPFTEYLPWIGIWNLAQITEIKVLDNIKEIGQCSFRHCLKLKKLEIPQECSIGEQAVQDTGITSFNCPKSMTKVPKDFFQICFSLKTYTIGGKTWEYNPCTGKFELV